MARSPAPAPTWPSSSAVAKKRIRQLETELAVARKVNEVSLEQGGEPRRAFPVIEALTGQGSNVCHACRTLGVSEAGYYAWRGRPTSPRALRRIFPAGQIVEVHRDSAGICGAYRITAELRIGHQSIVGNNAVAAIMGESRHQGTAESVHAGSARVGRSDCADLVRHAFARQARDEPWITDITEHTT